MDKDLIREVAEAIVREEIILNWQLYLILFGVTFLSVALTTFFASYMQKRGETFATQADFQKLISHLKSTTEAAERVRTEISHSDWVAREWKTLRRIKLEELLSKVHEQLNWAAELLDYSVQPKLQMTPNPQPMLGSIAKLYFPELAGEIHVFILKVANMAVNARQARVQLLKLMEQNEPTLEFISQYGHTFNESYRDLLNTVPPIENKARKVLKEIVGG